jgi:OOP family OmpA-OmpF porin
VAARSAYAVGQKGAAWQYNRAGLNSAALALNQAETSLAKQGDTKATRESATLALRRAQQAEIDGVATVRQQAEGASCQQAAPTAGSTTEEQTTQPAARSGEALATSATGEVKETESANIDEPRQKAVITLAVALFPVGQSTLPPDTYHKLDEIIDALRAEQNATVHIRGHADGTGSESRNKQISQERAEHVADYLASQGIARDHMAIDSVGDTQPITGENTAQDQAIDRRVQLVIYVPAKRAGNG